jgi:hypothetical protein
VGCGGDNGNEDTKIKRWAESVGMDIKKGRGEKMTMLYKRGHLGLKDDDIRMHRKGKKKDKKDKKRGEIKGSQIIRCTM